MTSTDTADTAPDTGAPLLVREMVAQQMRTTTTAIYRGITYVSLWTLLLCSAAFAAVQVWALRGYLPAGLPGPAAWALPVALQVLVLAAELILLSSAVTRSTPVHVTAGAVMTIGYGAEIIAHCWAGGPHLLTVTLVVMSTLLALCWTLLALALRAGITDADALVAADRARNEAAVGSVAPEPEPEPTPAPVPQNVADEPAPEPVLFEPEPTPAPVPQNVADEPAPEPVLFEPEPQPTTDMGSDLRDTDTDTADTVPRPGGQLSDVEMDAVIHMLYAETDPPRSYRETEIRFRELGYVGGAGRLRDSWHRVTQPAAVA